MNEPTPAPLPQSNSDRYYLLGRAVGRFDPHRKKLTPACVGNLSMVPHKAPVVLRHVWDQMKATPEVAELLDQIDWPNFHRAPGEELAYWFGIHRCRPIRSRRIDRFTVWRLMPI